MILDQRPVADRAEILRVPVVLVFHSTSTKKEERDIHCVHYKGY